MFRIYSLLLLLSCLCLACKSAQKQPTNLPQINKEQITLQTFPMNCSIRAITAADENTMWFGGSGGQFGYTEDGGESWHIDSIASSAPQLKKIRNKNSSKIIL